MNISVAVWEWDGLPSKIKFEFEHPLSNTTTNLADVWALYQKKRGGVLKTKNVTGIHHHYPTGFFFDFNHDSC